MTAIFSKCRLLFFCRQIMNSDVKILHAMIQKWPKVVIFHYALSLQPDWKTKMYIKIVRLWKQQKKKKTKKYFQPPIFFCPKSCGAIIFSCGIISTPLISQIFCVLDKEKELISFFSKQHFQIEKKIYKLISTTQQNQFRGISTKMMEKQKRKKFKKVKIHHQEIAKKKHLYTKKS